MSDSPSEDDDGGIFCQSCSPTTRKIGYYLTFIAGAIGLVIGFILSFFGSIWLVVIGSLLIIFSPFWIKSPRKCITDFKNILKVTSFLIHFVFLILVIIEYFMDWGGVVHYILAVCLGVSGLWYFLTFFPNGQKACIACMKACCGKSTS